MADQYEELRRAIEAAQTATDAIGEPWYGPDAGMGVIYIDPTGPAGRADFDYIAAANPATVLRLLAELDALREDARDAARYRWLRSNANSSFEPAGSGEVAWDMFFIARDLTVNTLDAAIDAALNPGNADSGEVGK